MKFNFILNLSNLGINLLIITNELPDSWLVSIAKMAVLKITHHNSFKKKKTLKIAYRKS